MTSESEAKDDGLDWHDKRLDPYCQAVGRIAIIWAQLEFVINQAIWQLANIEAGVGACVTAQIIAPSPRMRAFVALVAYRGGNKELLAEINRLGQKIEGAGSQRNRYVHDPAAIHVKTGEVKRINVTADKRLDFDFHNVDLREMDKLHKKIRSVTTEFDALFRRVLAELPAWPKTQYEQSPLGIRSHRPG